MDVDAIIASAARSVISLAPAMSGPETMSVELADIDRGSQRGYFTPDEDERIRSRFARYLGARAALLQTIDELRPIAYGSPISPSSASNTKDQPEHWTGDREVDGLRAFIVAYTAVALLVRAAQFIIERYAPNSVVQRKLNEAEPRFGIPRKQYTTIYRSFTSPFNAWRLRDALRYADLNRDRIMALRHDPGVADVLPLLVEAEPALRRPRRAIVLHRLRYRWHSWRRRRASAFQQVMFGIMEMGGRVIADMRNPFHVKRVTPAVLDELRSILRPGDVLISRHDDAASNLFLPGYWVHASLHIGNEAARRALSVSVDPDRAARWTDPVCILEARKDGVLFRQLSDTLAVDAVAVIRPLLEPPTIAQALGNAVSHEGKLYDFEFDFFRSDRLVCTGVVYRAYHGVGGLHLELRPRAGRPTLAAEDLLDLALARKGFEPVAVFGAPGAETAIVQGEACVSLLRNSYRTTG